MIKPTKDQLFWLKFAWIFMDQDDYLYEFFCRMGGLGQKRLLKSVERQKEGRK